MGETPIDPGAEPIPRGKEEKSVSEQRKVCLDPGHDAGNLANRSPDGTYYEHEFCLDMGRRIRDILERHGVAVTMTRDGGGAVSLAERCAIANSIQGLDLFVSLHSNAAAGSGWSSASGWSEYLYGPGGARERAALDILAAVRAAGIPVRGEPIVYDPKLYVLRHTDAPAVLLEQGFHTNEKEVGNLKDPAYRRRLAEAESKGILQYLGLTWREPDETEQAVTWAVENGIMRGSETGDLMLSEPVTRRQFDVMLWRYHQKFGR